MLGNFAILLLCSLLCVSSAVNAQMKNMDLKQNVMKVLVSPIYSGRLSKQTNCTNSLSSDTGEKREVGSRDCLYDKDAAVWRFLFCYSVQAEYLDVFFSSVGYGGLMLFLFRCFVSLIVFTAATLRIFYATQYYHISFDMPAVKVVDV